MAVVIKRIYAPAAAADGTRVLVERLWPRGMTKERARLDEWLRDVAPSPELRKWFAHDPARWQEFVRRYQRELRAPAAAAHVDRLRTVAACGPLTLLYAARDEHHNSAAVLAALIAA